MLDFGHFPTGTGDLQIFTSPSTVTNLQWLTWRKPRGCNMAYMLAVGGGGGGGGGFTGVAASARGGGGGGAAGGQSTLLISLFLLPDTLYIQVGAGGIGVDSGTATAFSGITSLISVSPDSTVNNIILSNKNPSNGGVTGTGAVAGAGGNSAVAAGIGQMPLAGLGVWQSFNTIAGTAGGAVAGGNGTAISMPITGMQTTGGTGGGGTTSADFQGGSFNPVGGTLVSQARPSTPSSGSFNGSGSPTGWKPFFSFGGLGGSSSNTLPGGMGGNGAYGAGGGGGGGGTTGGTGGNGGNGIVIIYSW